jgi:hypothetical protein
MSVETPKVDGLRILSLGEPHLGALYFIEAVSHEFDGSEQMEAI